MELPPLEHMEKKIYDMEMRLTPTTPSGDNKIVIIKIDDKSLEELGAWPWPRHIISDLVYMLHEKGTKLIEVDSINEVETFYEIREKMSLVGNAVAKAILEKCGIDSPADSN